MHSPCKTLSLNAMSICQNTFTIWIWMFVLVRGPNLALGLIKLERRETRKVGQREEKRTREAGTKMQCSTWWFIPSEATFRKYMFICTLNVQTYALEMFKKILRKTNLPHGSDHRWALNRSIIGFELSWNHKRLTKTLPRRELTCFTKQTLGMYPLGEHLSWLEFHIHSF